MENSLLISVSIFVLLFLSALLGLWVRSRLPEHHLSDSTKESVRIGMGSVASMAALVLGLLIASAKGSYETEKSEVLQMASRIICLDRTLANYGPESQPARELLRRMVQVSVHRIWPESEKALGADVPEDSWSRALPMTIQKLSPQSDEQRAFKTQAAQVGFDLSQMRWLLYEQSESAISLPLLGIMVFWLTLTFFSVGMFAPLNATVVAAQFLSALSVAGAIFLILELDKPFSGVIQISAQPMMDALLQLKI